jgi:osmotically-inducible protein OsmY
MRRKTLLSILCLLLFTCFAFSQEESKGTSTELTRKVEKKIRDNKKIDIENLKVLDENGTIYLEGIARLYGSVYLAEKAARKVDGVKDVKNHIDLQTEKADDVEIEGKIINKVRSNLRGTPFDLVSIKSHSGFVVLEGNVRDTTLVDDAINASIWVPGVRGVENKMTYASISSSDERLRQLIFARLNREFPQYFLGKDPSILIIVNNARVQLVGYVDTNVSVQKIGTIVRSINGVLSLNNQLQTSH